ncbi:conserved hypothetical protein [Leishmania infantum JPCM5]|uniref:Uncharacterized protein n=2 Tax=Leishmania infantum TaxID=5671 RepID=A4I0N3_LEIIN|nr:conserved hypothetical protein [Leishmania infantum JPCM5]CAC9491077.1 hypothetical_protein_-_conserved [Leishmania infantum]CAM68305.1 conserved hypothetical protein [Leishmania infantum JPCM5]SUZ42124.1 hypothetical_protein_-_conserved [Leishmania infantum]|eukprot:XP_001465874.1 conserved hypothetical protein [Leishmania infantum JPCM5]
MRVNARQSGRILPTTPVLPLALPHSAFSAPSPLQARVKLYVCGVCARASLASPLMAEARAPYTVRGVAGSSAYGAGGGECDVVSLLMRAVRSCRGGRGRCCVGASCYSAHAGAICVLGSACA